jgi:hypothetical protein
MEYYLLLDREAAVVVSRHPQSSQTASLVLFLSAE